MPSHIDCLKGKTALVTGGAKRIGRALSLALAGRGVNVIIHYHRSSGEAEKTLSDVRQLGVSAWKIRAELSSTPQVQKLIPRAKAKAGRIDFLINNASVFTGSRLKNFTVKEFSRTFHVNALAPFILTRNFAMHMRKGAVVNLLDSRIKGLDLGHVSYGLSKKTLRDMTRLLAVELAPRIRVNGIAPGIILPPKGKSRSSMRNILSRNLMNAPGRVSDITEAVCFLLANPFITGEILFVDGGEKLKGLLYGKRKE
ncbi:MAG: SDR family oxidoreductase [Candidatus Aureabacteria bacterium]|nr:SDR family oxidoreductase [Candidatus Auribacterota bacterium]